MSLPSWKSRLLLSLAAVAVASAGGASLDGAAEADCALDGTCAGPGADGGDGDASLDPALISIVSTLPLDESLYLNGAFRRPAPNDVSIESIDPSTGRLLGRVAAATELDVGLAVRSARRAFESDWSDRSDDASKRRRDLVSKFLHLRYKPRAEDLAALVAAEMGAPYDFALESQVGSVEDAVEQFLEEVDEENFRRYYRLSDEGDAMVYLDPIGVVGLVTPWNWPLYQIALKVIPALLVGCTVILKPSEVTPLTSLYFADLIHKAGFPPGVFQLVNGYGPGHVGEWLASHPDVDMISFTGSTLGGSQVSAAAAGTTKRVSLEMGGKGANVIFGDLALGYGQNKNMKPFRREVENGVMSVMSNSGQSCDAPTRMLVPEEHWDFALEVARETAETVVVGAASEEGKHIGPVASDEQYDRVQRYIQSAIDEGATLLAGGLGKPVPEEDDDDATMKDLQRHYERGYYVRPTIFAGCTPNMTIWKEEVFGPVLCVTKFASEEEAIRLANDAEYGLTNYVHSTKKKLRQRLSRRLKSGTIAFNGKAVASAAPFGGVKRSGHGREGGLWGLEEFCVMRVVSGVADDYMEEVDPEEEYHGEEEARLAISLPATWNAITHAAGQFFGDMTGRWSAKREEDEEEEEEDEEDDDDEEEDDDDDEEEED